jgi:hypothetical protein
MDPIVDLIPASKYLSQIIDVHMRLGDGGEVVSIRMIGRIAKGEFTNELWWDVLKFDSASPQVVAIAKRKLQELADATGELNITCPGQLRHQWVIADVRIRGLHDLKNYICSYSPIPS